MGATQSQQTRLDPALPQELNDARTSRSRPHMPPPRMGRVETFDEKLYRKFSQEPLVPIGCLVTAYFLGSGIRSFYQRDAMRSQRMMRARVGAQFATLMIFIGYYGMSEFNLKFAPGMAPHKKEKDEKD